MIAPYIIMFKLMLRMRGGRVVDISSVRKSQFICRRSASRNQIFTLYMDWSI